jgi:hypothetical protein
MSVVVIFIYFFSVFDRHSLNTTLRSIRMLCILSPTRNRDLHAKSLHNSHQQRDLHFSFSIYFCVFLSCLFWITSYCCSFNPQLRFFIWSIPSIRFGFAKHINNSPKTAHSTYGRTWTILLLMYMSVIICCQRRRRRFVIHVYNAMRHPADYVFL